MKSFFQTNLEICHIDPKRNEELLKNYISFYNFRIRNQIDNVSFNFWERYGNEIIKCAKNRKLLFRAKYINDICKTVNILNIWESRKVFNQFYSFCDGSSLIKAFKNKKFHAEYTFLEVHPRDFKKHIEKISLYSKYAVEFHFGDASQQNLIKE